VNQTTVERKAAFPEGTRVRAVNFVLDDGLRIWPLQNQHLGTAQGKSRVVRVADQRVLETLMVGSSAECEAAYPDARWTINDNESVPPGTEGTVRDVDDAGTIHVAWDNGRSIGVTTEDTVERL